MAHRLLNGVSAVGAGPGIFLAETVSEHTCEVSFVDANSSITALTVNLEGSASPRSVGDAGAHWHILQTYPLNSTELANRRAMFHVEGKPCRRVRLNVAVLTGADTGDAITARYVPRY